MRVSWTGTAQELSREGDVDLADRVLAVACEHDPDDALLLWQRAMNLRTGGMGRRCAPAPARGRRNGRNSTSGSGRGPSGSWTVSRARVAPPFRRPGLEALA